MHGEQIDVVILEALVAALAELPVEQGEVFVLGLNKNGEDLSGAGLIAIGLGVLGLYVTRPRKD